MSIGAENRSVAARPSSRSILARLDRIDTWSLPYVFIGVIGLGFLFTFSTSSTSTSLKTPVVLNLAGYVVGTLILSPLADRVGRRNMLMVTMGLTGLGSLYNALAPDYTNFVIARIITGIGIGADLAIVNTFVGEMAPRRSRAKFTSLIFCMSAIGALLGIWLGLVLTTEPAPWAKGLSFAQAGPSFDDGWRWMYAVGALLALIAIVLRVQLPESPRWLLGRGRVEAADEVVADMERTASRHGPLPEPGEVEEEIHTHDHMPYRYVLGHGVHLRRVILLVLVWFIGYVTVYGFSAGFTSVLTAQGYEPPEAGVIVAVGAFGFLLCAVVAVLYSERLDRKVWLPISAAITLLGSAIVAAAGDTLAIAFIGSAVIFFGFNLWVPMTYARSAESFPTSARTTGFALVDGVGHLGGGIGVLLIAPAIPHLSILGALMLISGFLVVAAVLAMFGVETRNRRFEEISL